MRPKASPQELSDVNPVSQVLAPGTELANLVLGPVRINFPSWTHTERESVLFLQNESFWRLFNTVCMGLWTGVITTVPISHWLKLPWEGVTPSLSGTAGSQRREKQTDPQEAGALIRLDTELAQNCPLSVRLK